MFLSYILPNDNDVNIQWLKDSFRKNLKYLLIDLLLLIGMIIISEKLTAAMKRVAKKNDKLPVKFLTSLIAVICFIVYIFMFFLVHKISTL